MAIYVRPTKSLCLLTAAVILFAGSTVAFIAFTLAHEISKEAVQRHFQEVHK